MGSPPWSAGALQDSVTSSSPACAVQSRGHAGRVPDSGTAYGPHSDGLLNRVPVASRFLARTRKTVGGPVVEAGGGIGLDGLPMVATRHCWGCSSQLPDFASSTRNRLIGFSVAADAVPRRGRSVEANAQRELDPSVARPRAGRSITGTGLGTAGRRGIETSLDLVARAVSVTRPHPEVVGPPVV